MLIFTRSNNKYRKIIQEKNGTQIYKNNKSLIEQLYMVMNIVLPCVLFFSLNLPN